MTESETAAMWRAGCSAANHRSRHSLLFHSRGRSPAARRSVRAFGLGSSRLPAAPPRVLRPAGDAGRLSLPFLVRCRNDHVLDTRPYDPTSSNARLVEVHGVTCKELRLLFDARGKRLLEAERDAAAAAAEKEEERKRRAREYREALSDSSDED